MVELLHWIIASIHVVFTWRLLLCIIGPLPVTFAISNALGVEVKPGLLFHVLLLGFTFGLIWQTRSESGERITDPVRPLPVSKPIAFSGLAVVGGILGLIESSIFGSFILGAVALMVLVGVVYLWYRVALRQKIGSRTLTFLGASLLTGFFGAILLAYVSGQ